MRRFNGWLDDHEPLVALGCVAAFLAMVFLLGGCGSTPSHPQAKPDLGVPPAAHVTPTPVGCMGPCVSTLKVGLAPKAGATRPRLPDISEWQPCVDRAVPAVFRLAYGSRQDTRASCNGRYLAAHRVWRAGYTYLTGSCAAQGRVAASIAHSVGGVSLIIGDGEIALPPHCLADFRSAAHKASGDPTATYTGCFSGLERVQPLWVPSYGASPACGPFEAWQYTDGSYCGESYVTDCSFDYGITSVREPSPPKPPTHAQTVARWHRELLAHYRLRKLLWQDIGRERCPRPSKARYRAVCGRWGVHLRVEQREILAFHRRGIY